MRKKLSPTRVGRFAGMLRTFVVAHVRSNRPNLTVRQIAILLTCYLEGNGSQTVGGLATRLGASRSAISRALDRLEHFRLVARRTDSEDRRIVRLAWTIKGARFVRDVNLALKAAAKGSRVTLR